ncbi:diphthamide synthesis protein [Candidatus Woesearchaeota archaeon]|nr:diphthamide synthesis protein [Candidatus Woesearchaeota archaeon]
MKTLFLEARVEIKIILPDSLLAKLPQRIALFTTVQFFDNIEAIKNQLESENKTVILLTGPHSKYAGQALGCTIEDFDAEKYNNESFDAFLYIGDGMFHPDALLIKNQKDVYCYNPYTKQTTVLDKLWMDKSIKQQKGALLRFYTSQNIGIVISIKPGQYHLRKARELEKKFPNKKFYTILFSTIDFNQLENFNFIDCWVNTACPRIAYDDFKKFPKAVIDVDEILNPDRAR